MDDETFFEKSFEDEDNLSAVAIVLELTLSSDNNCVIDDLKFDDDDNVVKNLMFPVFHGSKGMLILMS